MIEGARRRQIGTILLVELIVLTIVLFDQSVFTIALFAVTQLRLVVVSSAVYWLDDHRFPGAIWARMTAYFIPDLLPFVLFAPRSPQGHGLSVAALAVALVPVLLILWARRIELRRSLNPRFLALMMPEVSNGRLALVLYNSLGSAVTQELYYKLFVIGGLLPLVGPTAAVILSAVLFAADHTVHPDAARFFSVRDYLGQMIAALATGAVFVYTGSIAPAIAAHLIYNAVAGCGPEVVRFATQNRAPETDVA
jgi:membrane protease YdiL (CAAX protease family)